MAGMQQNGGEMDLRETPLEMTTNKIPRPQPRAPTHHTITAKKPTCGIKVTAGRLNVKQIRNKEKSGDVTLCISPHLELYHWLIVEKQVDRRVLQASLSPWDREKKGHR